MAFETKYNLTEAKSMLGFSENIAWLHRMDPIMATFGSQAFELELMQWSAESHLFLFMRQNNRNSMGMEKSLLWRSLARCQSGLLSLYLSSYSQMCWKNENILRELVKNLLQYSRPRNLTMVKENLPVVFKGPQITYLHWIDIVSQCLQLMFTSFLIPYTTHIDQHT